MVVQEVVPGVFAATGMVGANTGLIQTDIGSVLVDAPFVPSQARAWRAEVERLSPAGVAYLINTDHHLGHILGNCYLPTALTIGHELAWKQLKALDRSVVVEKAIEQAHDQLADLGAQLADVRIILPQLTVGHTMTLWCGSQSIDILHLGGHTPGTLAVYLPAHRLLFAGDIVVNGRHPYVGDANSRQWLEALQKLRTMDLETIVPGHGPLAGPEIIDTLYQYLAELRGRVEACFRAGHTRRETVERVKLFGAFPVAPGDDERVRRILRSSAERIYDEIKKEASRSRERGAA